VDHEEAGAAMRGRGRGWLAVLLGALAVLGAVAAERRGVATPAPAPSGVAVSSAWVCPHGGGDRWTANVAIANPGASPIDARLTSLGDHDPRQVGTVAVPASGEVIAEVPARGRGASTLVEIFGGSAAVGWIVQAGGKGSGIGAEPCTDDAGATWSVVDGVTNRQTDSSVVIANPFAADAVVNVVLYLPDKPPLRDTDWTDLRIRAGSSVALDLRRALGEQIVGATVEATRGRVAVGSLAVGARGGVRSVLAQPAFATRWIAPVAGGTGSGTLSLLVPGDLGIRFGATQLSTDSNAQPSGNLTVIRQGGSSTVSAPVTTAGSSAVVVQVVGNTPVSVGLREVGRGSDDAATAGTATPATSWIALPTTVGRNAQSNLVLVNDGTQPVSATLQMLPAEGGDGGAPYTLAVAPGRTASPPRSWLDANPTAAILITGDGNLVALSAGTTGRDRSGSFAVAMGVPLWAAARAGP
jgi:hypothetical protein